MDYQMDTAPVVVTQRVGLELLDGAGTALPMEAELRYDAGDPYAVTAVFMTVAGQVRWTFGRDLLIEGLHEPAGDGDVHVWPCLDADGRAVVVIELCSPEGEALVQARTCDLAGFAERTVRAVAPGTESTLLDVDGAIAAILAEAA